MACFTLPRWHHQPTQHCLEVEPNYKFWTVNIFTHSALHHIRNSQVWGLKILKLVINITITLYSRNMEWSDFDHLGLEKKQSNKHLQSQLKTCLGFSQELDHGMMVYADGSQLTATQPPQKTIHLISSQPIVIHFTLQFCMFSNGTFLSDCFPTPVTQMVLKTHTQEHTWPYPMKENLIRKYVHKWQYRYYIQYVS